MLNTSAQPPCFANRYEAGLVLADRLRPYAYRDDVVVLGLPRGGVPVAYEVARAIGAAFDVFVVRKLGVPQQPELAMGAIASGGVRVLNEEVVRWYRIPQETIDLVARDEEQELARREQTYRSGRPGVPIANKVAILVDDGLATGSTMRAAITAIRRLNPSRVIVGVPVGARNTCAELEAVADEIVCAHMPPEFSAVGECARTLPQMPDDEVTRLLQAIG